MTSDVAGLTVSRVSADQAWSCAHTDVSITLTVTLSVVFRRPVPGARDPPLRDGRGLCVTVNHRLWRPR